MHTEVPDATSPQAYPALQWEIQALRGLAVGAVLLFHAQLLPAGYLGVDLFFVISGFLITGLVLQGQRQGRFSLVAFYWRRAKRLLPAAYACLAAVVLAAPWWLNRAELADLREQLWGSLGFASNLVLWQQTGYFSGVAERKPLLHFWSLSIEEQYYLVLPLLLLALAWRARSAQAAWHRHHAALLLGCGISLGFCLWLAPRHGAAAFYLLPTRAWELGLGSLGALWVQGAQGQPLGWLRADRCQGLLRRLQLPLVILLLAALMGRPASWWAGAVHPGTTALLVGVSTLLLLLKTPERRAAPLLLWPLLRLGDWSYSLYLLHWPLLAFASNAWVGAGPVPLGWRLGALLVALLAAAGLYRFLESPLRQAEIRPSWRGLALVLGLSSLLALAPLQLWPQEAPRPGQPTRQADEGHGLGPSCDHVAPFKPSAACLRQAADGTAPRWLVWGDSYAMQLVPGLLPSAPGLVQATMSSCGPFTHLLPYRPERVGSETYGRRWTERCQAFNASVLDWLSRRPEIDTVILSSVLIQYVDAQQYQQLDWSVDGGPRPQRLDRTRLLREAGQFVATLQQLGKRVVWVAPPPSSGFDIAACTERLDSGRLTLGAPADCSVALADYHRERAQVLSLLDELAQLPGLHLLRFDPLLCDQERCATRLDGVLLYRDAGHLSNAGMQKLAQRLDWAVLLRPSAASPPPEPALR